MLALKGFVQPPERMLISLYVKDFAIVSEVEIAFGPGLTVVSGETGAGKSLLVDALLFLTGARADAGMVRHGAERAELTAEFLLRDAAGARQWLLDHDFDDGQDCQLRRTLRADGGSRAWINGRPATLSQLAELGERLVEIHGQHEHQALLERPLQLALLDAFARLEPVLAPVREHARQATLLARRIEAVQAQGDVAERIGWLGHQYDELEAEALGDGEIESLLAAHRRQAHAAGLIEACERAVTRLGGDDGDSVGTALHTIRSDLGRLTQLEPRLGEVLSALDGAEIQLQEATRSLERVRDDLELDPARLAQLEARLARLHELARKHRVPLEGLAARRDALRAERDALAEAGASLEGLQRDLAVATAAWREAAAVLSAARREGALRLGASVSALMDELGMVGGSLSIQLEPRDDPAPDPLGAERVEFLVAANPGQPPRPLRKVASGGELSRISLAIEVAALGLDAVRTMVFDEVDTGIGGAVADVVGRKLRDLAAERQVLCVTHLPQVAAHGHHHLQVSKAATAGNTASRIDTLNPERREEEIARMLGGVEITRETRAHARQLLRRAANG
jgi:DNA repair protein RecN (Recombination protein N)